MLLQWEQVEILRECAEYTERRAQKICDPEAKQVIEDIARSWRDRAAQAERNDPGLQLTFMKS